MSDTISRRAAIDALKNRWKKTRNYEGIGDDIAEECELYLKQVPSAQSYSLNEWCTDCKEYDQERRCCPRFNRVIRQTLSEQPEIVRCKECKHWDTTWTNDWSPNYHYCPIIDGVRKDDFYCADAERRNDEGNVQDK